MAAILDAVRAKGWFVCVFQYFEWDEWVIQNRNGDPIGKTTKKDGLRNKEALLTALDRALEVIDA